VTDEPQDPAGTTHRPAVVTDVFTGAVVMAPMTRGSNLPYRRLCAALGASTSAATSRGARSNAGPSSEPS
jgi:hypothetical protein